ncbi:MAG: BNR-4 repeat-containing protein [Candidatus Cyclobacteriaceae bacterium M3_2C_046]
MNHKIFLFLLITVLSIQANTTSAQQTELDQKLSYHKADGYRGIWFSLGQFFSYGDKYSGGLGTYTAKHIPIAIYRPEVQKTFFVYGGTTDPQEKYLLNMIGVYDHQTNMVTQPTIVYDKQGVDDPHDNPSLSIDKEGHIWVFVSGRGRSRPGFKYKSMEPYAIDTFQLVGEDEMTYPQPWYLQEEGFVHLFTKYSGRRELYFETSPDGITWSADQKLAGIKREKDRYAGHYQMSNVYLDKVVTFFNWHPDGNVDRRTNLYYLQSEDGGQTWTNIEGKAMDLPLENVDSPALVFDFFSQGQNVYLKDVNFDSSGNPVGLILTSQGHEPGPQNFPRAWQVVFWNGAAWQIQLITYSDHNYDMGSLFIEEGKWQVVIPSVNKPQTFGAGGEIVQWESSDQGRNWTRKDQLTTDSPLNHNYIRRVYQGQAPFRYFWADGDPFQFSQSKLYFGNLKGEVWQLPYHMEQEYALPLKMDKP